MAKPKDASKSIQAIVGLPDENGARPTIGLYEDRIEIGEVRPLRTGKSATPGAYPVSLEGDGPYRTMTFLDKMPPRKGPAKVNSPAFRQNWDSIFGKQEVGQA
jgi:hypothetical protein